MSEPIIQVEKLTKRYGQSLAVDGLDLTIKKGEVFGLLGPNGSGKTTTILMILGLTEPSSGSVRVLGMDPGRQPLSVKSQVGYLPDQVGFYENLSAKENLIYTAKLNGIRVSEASLRIDEVLKQMGLENVRDQRVKIFSRGMRQRLGVAEILLKQPNIIIMDEPTLGLDPEAARMFLDIISNLKASGITILLSSHLLQQVQEVCDRVGLFYKGKMLLEGRVEELASKVLGGTYRIRLQVDGIKQPLETLLESVPGILNVHSGDNSGWHEVESNTDLRAEIANTLVRAGGQLKALDVEVPTLDEVYATYFKEVHDAA